MMDSPVDSPGSPARTESSSYQSVASTRTSLNFNIDLLSHLYSNSGTKTSEHLELDEYDDVDISVSSPPKEMTTIFTRNYPQIPNISQWVAKKDVQVGRSNLGQELGQVKRNDHSAHDTNIHTKSHGSSTAKDEEHHTWNHSKDFIVLTLCYVIGAYNFGPFTLNVLKEGGGAHFIPYFLSLFVFGFPLTLLEFSIGQFTSRGSTSCWKFALLFKGLGFSMLIAVLLVTVSYAMEVTWSLHYMFRSGSMPWNHCFEQDVHGRDAKPQTWSTDKCQEIDTFKFPQNTTFHEAVKTLSGFEYLHRRVYHETSEDDKSEFWISAYFRLDSSLVLQLFLTMTIVAGMLCMKLQNLGKIPFTILVIVFTMAGLLLYKGASLEGASDGLAMFFKPRWEELTNISIWVSSIARGFLKLGLCCGALTSLASYNDFQHNFVRSAFIISLCDFLASIFFGLIMSSYIGAFAFRLNTTVTEIVNIVNGNSVLFIMPMIFADSSSAGIWTFFLFATIFCLSLSTEVIFVKIVTDGISALLPGKYRRVGKYNVLGVSLLITLLAVPLCSASGKVVFDTIQLNCCGVTYILLGVCEVASVGYIYGVRKFMDACWCMNRFCLFARRKENVMFWTIYMNMFLLCSLFLVVLIEVENYDASRELGLSDYFGYVIRLVVLMPIIVAPVLHCVLDKDGGSMKERLQRLVTPAEDFGPRSRHNRRRWIEYSNGI